jgi:hypothetical protein
MIARNHRSPLPGIRNFTHTRAVVYVELLYCGLCGGGQYYYLAKENGVWRVTDVAGTWIS